MNDNRLAKRVRSLRGLHTQREAAEIAEISQATFQNIELGKNKSPHQLTLKRIARGFGGSDWEKLWRELMEYAHPVAPLDERLTNQELDRLSRRLAPVLAKELLPELERLLKRLK